MVYTVRIEPDPKQRNRDTDERNYRKKQVSAAKWLNGISGAAAVIAFLALIALAVNAWLIHCQLKAMLDLNGVTREAVESVQRAFVFYSPNGISQYGVIETNGSRNTKGWVFYIPYKNAGNTPTRNLTDHVSVYHGPQITDGFDFRDFQDGQSSTADPQTTIYYATTIFPTDVIHQAELGLQHIYFYGWATYNDVFPKTPKRVTKFCFELHVSGDWSAIGTMIGTQSSLCMANSKTLHNCSDEDCGNQNPN